MANFYKGARMLSKIESLLKPMIKSCARIKAVPTDFSPEKATEIRFGGPAYAEKDSAVPICKSCGKPLSFVFQFRENSIEKSGGLLQFFYCFSCLPWGGKDEDGQWLVRYFASPANDKFVFENAGTADESIKPSLATINKVKMLPDFESLEEENHQVIGLCEEVDPDDPWDVYEEACMVMGCEIEPFSSVGGYPIWIQGVTARKCPLCKEEMKFVAQIDSVPEAELMWGDAGCVYLFRCSKHTDEFAFEMQCF